MIQYLLNYLFGICVCSILTDLSNVSNLFQNGHFPIFSMISNVRDTNTDEDASWDVMVISNASDTKLA